MDSLINALYGELLDSNCNGPLQDQYHLNRTILSAKNTEVDDINQIILERSPGDKSVYLSADSVPQEEGANYDYIPEELLHRFQPSGFPLHKLEIKIGSPLMLLCNLDPIHGLYNGTRLILIRALRRVLEC